jgi:hypothetical protein
MAFSPSLPFKAISIIGGYDKRNKFSILECAIQEVNKFWSNG